MKILKDAGKAELLGFVEHLEAQLHNIEHAGRTCYQSEKGPITRKSAQTFITKILRRGHESVIEHSAMTVRFSNVSRGFTHEMMRHRLCSFSQESTRYVNESDLHFIMPPHRDDECILARSDKDVMGKSPREAVADMEAFYRALLEDGWQKQDARQFLPIGTRAQIVVTANFREWRHIFDMRTAKAAHWEIRRVMSNLLAQVRPLLSPIFDDFELGGEDKNGVPFWCKDSKGTVFSEKEMSVLQFMLSTVNVDVYQDPDFSKRELRELKLKLGFGK